MSSVLQNLRLLRTTLFNATGGAPAATVLADYQKWASQSAETLGYSFPHDDVERLIMTRRHWSLMGLDGSSDEGLIRFAVSAERVDRLRVLDALITEFAAIEQRWTGVTSTVVVADANVYLHAVRSFDSIDWCRLVGAPAVSLLIPMQVVRELDRAKRFAHSIKVGGDKDSGAVRDRARRTIKKLRDAFADVDAEVNLSPTVLAELVLDPIGRVPIEHGDTEIIDRALALKALVGRQVSIVTEDGGMQFSASAAGLQAVPLFEQS